jgi:hypothetical protein
MQGTPFFESLGLEEGVKQGKVVLLKDHEHMVAEVDALVTSFKVHSPRFIHLLFVLMDRYQDV